LVFGTLFFCTFGASEATSSDSGGYVLDFIALFFCAFGASEANAT
jgi:hypothetical protein